ncbi:MAG: IS1634 family transposase [Streptosporangiaceae bacterium]
MNTPAPFTLTSTRLGALPLISHFAARMGLRRLLEAWMPADDPRLALDPAAVIALLIANLATGHRPLYALGEWAAGYQRSLLGLGRGGAALLNDDRAGRALDRLFRADRGSLLTELMTGVISEFGIDCSRLHNDSTSVSVHGTYEAADGSDVAGVPTAEVTRGHSKDHRPDLKQLVFILTVSGDHAVPVIYRLADGNTSDDPAHIPTWDTLVKLTGGPDFLYVADCKLASDTAMSHIHRGGGRFITVLPRSRKEDTAFRAWIPGHQPAWAEASRVPGTRIGDPDLVHSTYEAPWPSAAGYRIVWVHDSGKQHHDAVTRARRIEKGVKAIEEDLAARLASPRTRLRTAEAVHAAAKAALAAAHASRWVRYAVTEQTDLSRKQAGPGRPGPGTAYRTITTRTFEMSCDVDYDQVARDAASDGCWPLITNDQDMTGAEVLAAYHYQPNLERRHHLLKGIQDAAPAWIKTIPRIEAIFLCHFIALLLCALIERQIKMAMKTAQIAKIPLYPELRGCAAPSADRIFEIFADLTRHELRDADGTLVQAFEPELTRLQRQILDLLDIPATAYTNINRADR